MSASHAEDPRGSKRKSSALGPTYNDQQKSPEPGSSEKHKRNTQMVDEGQVLANLHANAAPTISLAAGSNNVRSDRTARPIDRGAAGAASPASDQHRTNVANQASGPKPRTDAERDNFQSQAFRTYMNILADYVRTRRARTACELELSEAKEKYNFMNKFFEYTKAVHSHLCKKQQPDLVDLVSEAEARVQGTQERLQRREQVLDEAEEKMQAITINHDEARDAFLAVAPAILDDGADYRSGPRAYGADFRRTLRVIVECHLSIVRASAEQLRSSQKTQELEARAKDARLQLDSLTTWHEAVETPVLQNQDLSASQRMIADLAQAAREAAQRLRHQNRHLDSAKANQASREVEFLDQLAEPFLVKHGFLPPRASVSTPSTRGPIKDPKLEAQHRQALRDIQNNQETLQNHREKYRSRQIHALMGFPMGDTRADFDRQHHQAMRQAAMAIEHAEARRDDALQRAKEQGLLNFQHQTSDFGDQSEDGAAGSESSSAHVVDLVGKGLMAAEFPPWVGTVDRTARVEIGSRHTPSEGEETWLADLSSPGASDSFSHPAPEPKRQKRIATYAAAMEQLREQEEKARKARMDP